MGIASELLEPAAHDRAARTRPVSDKLMMAADGVSIMQGGRTVEVKKDGQGRTYLDFVDPTGKIKEAPIYTVTDLLGAIRPGDKIQLGATAPITYNPNEVKSASQWLKGASLLLGSSPMSVGAPVTTQNDPNVAVGTPEKPRSTGVLSEGDPNSYDLSNIDLSGGGRTAAQDAADYAQANYYNTQAAHAGDSLAAAGMSAAVAAEGNRLQDAYNYAALAQANDQFNATMELDGKKQEEAKRQFDLTYGLSVEQFNAQKTQWETENQLSLDKFLYQKKSDLATLSTNILGQKLQDRQAAAQNQTSLFENIAPSSVGEGPQGQRVIDALGRMFGTDNGLPTTQVHIDPSLWKPADTAAMTTEAQTLAQQLLGDQPLTPMKKGGKVTKKKSKGVAKKPAKKRPLKNPPMSIEQLLAMAGRDAQAAPSGPMPMPAPSGPMPAPAPGGLGAMLAAGPRRMEDGGIVRAAGGAIADPQEAAAIAAIANGTATPAQRTYAQNYATQHSATSTPATTSGATVSDPLTDLVMNYLQGLDPLTRSLTAGGNIIDQIGSLFGNVPTSLADQLLASLNLDNKPGWTSGVGGQTLQGKQLDAQIAQFAQSLSLEMQKIGVSKQQADNQAAAIANDAAMGKLDNETKVMIAKMQDATQKMAIAAQSGDTRYAADAQKEASMLASNLSYKAASANTREAAQEHQAQLQANPRNILEAVAFQAQQQPNQWATMLDQFTKPDFSQGLTAGLDGGTATPQSGGLGSQILGNPVPSAHGAQVEGPALLVTGDKGNDGNVARGTEEVVLAPPGTEVAPLEPGEPLNRETALRALQRMRDGGVTRAADGFPDRSTFAGDLLRAATGYSGQAADAIAKYGVGAAGVAAARRAGDTMAANLINQAGVNPRGGYGPTGGSESAGGVPVTNAMQTWTAPDGTKYNYTTPAQLTAAQSAYAAQHPTTGGGGKQTWTAPDGTKYDYTTPAQLAAAQNTWNAQHPAPTTPVPQSQQPDYNRSLTPGNVFARPSTNAHAYDPKTTSLGATKTYDPLTRTWKTTYSGPWTGARPSSQDPAMDAAMKTLDTLDGQTLAIAYGLKRDANGNYISTKTGAPADMPTVTKAASKYLSVHPTVTGQTQQQSAGGVPVTNAGAGAGGGAGGGGGQPAGMGGTEFFDAGLAAMGAPLAGQMKTTSLYDALGGGNPEFKSYLDTNFNGGLPTYSQYKRMSPTQSGAFESLTSSAGIDPQDVLTRIARDYTGFQPKAQPGQTASVGVM